MSNTKIIPQNASMNSRSTQLEAQISNLDVSNNYENFEVIHEDGNNEASLHDLPS